MAESISTLVLCSDEATLGALATQLAAEPEVLVVGRARLPERAVQICLRQAPRAAVLHLARAADLELLAAVLREAPLPVVAICAAAELGVQALQVGVAEVLGADAPAAKIVESLRLMSQVHVIRPKRTAPLPPRSSAPPPVVAGAELTSKLAWQSRRLVGLGASTGGPQVLVEILGALPRSFSAALVIAQHMPRDFHASLAAWLGSTVSLPVTVAQAGTVLQPGHVYLAPGDADLEIGPGGVARLLPANRQGPVPSVDTLFQSLARLREVDLCGVLLSGMGRDGAVGLKALRDAGALTLVQTRHSSAVSSMPESALSLDAADLVLAPSQIALELLRWAAGAPA